MNRAKINRDDITFRSLREEEFQQITEVFNKAFKLNKTAEEYRHRFKGKDAPDLGSQFVAIHKDRVVAGVRADHKPLYFIDSKTGKNILHECGEINDVATFPKYRRLGLARILLNHAIMYMEDKKWDLALLQADPNYHAKDLYSSLGFNTLKSTGDIFHASIGYYKILWAYFKVFAFIKPIIPWLTRRIAPKPPRMCMDLVKKPRKKRSIKENLPYNLEIIQVRSPIVDGSAWIKEWDDNVRIVMKQAQALNEKYINSLFIIDQENQAISNTIRLKFKKNKYFKQFLDDGGGKYNYILMKRSINAKSQNIESVNIQIENSNDIESGNIIGGARFKLDVIENRGLRITFPFIDVAWIHPKFQKSHLGSLFLNKCKKIIFKYFPFVVCRSSSGNIQYRKALLNAGFKVIGGAITMVKPLKNKTLYDDLKSRVEPWLLYE